MGGRCCGGTTTTIYITVSPDSMAAAAATSAWKHAVLGDGQKAPGIAYGLGTANYGRTGPNGVDPGLVKNIHDALKAGFRHIDNAEMYANEQSSGAATKSFPLSRDELFITTKVSKEVEDIRATLKKQLTKLEVDYVDLYLIHDPTCGDKVNKTRAQLWEEMEAVKAEGLAKSIGVSNYTIKHLEDTLPAVKTSIAANQIELHPYVIDQTQPLLDFCAEHNIKVEAYGPLGPLKAPGGPVDPVVEKIAKDLNCSTGSVLLKWAEAKGALVVTTSGKPERMAEMISAGRLSLSQAQVDEIQTAGSKMHKRFFMGHAWKDGEGSA